jgi:hypothetical protein
MIQCIKNKNSKSPPGAHPLGTDLPLKKGGNMKTEVAKLNPNYIDSKYHATNRTS